ncbi:hypothetical protein Thimo_0999 [Thioflavicoccus mobilis 8321]|uniref:Sulfotransferase family n=1 Tax=Thioflavicoccus mobilis 8321 TaxID=765912 RepID=L0GV02_9GAMM|nr:hypothetical protein [Thioflavicoccus mobilis]AGA89821.1 hypothetical protein Thimo_0999 [Thioflavicoccus mobilis 8321]
MIVSLEKGFVFTRGVKTASNSMRATLEPFRRPFESSLTARMGRKGLGLYQTWPFVNFYANPHRPLVYAAHVIPPRLFASFYKFGVVREPVSWMTSVYKHWLTRWSKSERSIRTFEDFVHYWTGFRSYTQALQFVDLQGHFLADEIGRFENLLGFHEHVCQRLGIQRDLQRLNATPDTVRVEVTARARSLVEKLCYLDYEIFDFENLSEPIMDIQLDETISAELRRRLRCYGGVSYDPWASSYSEVALGTA